MIERIEDLTGIRGILLSVHVSAVSNQWHLDNRAVPSLRARGDQTDDPHLRHAAEKATAAREHLEAARQSLFDAMTEIDALAASPITEGEPG